MTSTDWDAWHHDYADPGSALSRRLRTVQAHLRDELDARPGPLRVLSLCAGDGRDLLEVLDGRPDADRVSGVLVETDDRNVDRARAELDRLGLAGLEMRNADAARTDAFEDAVPADLVLLCGIFGNIGDDDVARTVAAAPQLCAPGALVLWTRHRQDPDLTPRIRAWFASAGFAEVAFTAPDDGIWSVGAHRLVGEPRPLVAGERLFTFVR
ncbi:MAG: class I SAM-dependent methyltransferase family protein [Nocardioidaceae bacterium]